MGIVEFLEARIAEDEADALPFRNELGETKQWQCDEIGGAVRYVGPRPFGLPDLLAKFEIHAEGAHVARWDPSRVLAECAAKRVIVGTYKAVAANRNEVTTVQWHEERALLTSLRALADVYKDHPDYSQEWKP